MRTLAALLLAGLLTGCGGGGHDESTTSSSVEVQVLEKVRQDAPSWDDTSDEDILLLTQRVCGGDFLETEAAEAGVSEHDRGYLVGISLSALC